MEIACEMQTKTAKDINISSSFPVLISSWIPKKTETHPVFTSFFYMIPIDYPYEIPIFPQHFLAPCGLEVCFDTSGSPEPEPGVAGDKAQGQTYALPKIGCLAMLVHIYICRVLLYFFSEIKWNDVYISLEFYYTVIQTYNEKM